MDHPDDKLLQQYCAGKLPKELEEQIEQHILSCVQCDRHLDQIEQNYNKKSLDIFKKANNYTTTKEINSNDLLCHQYLKVKLLGRGGMGEVWKAYDTVAKRDVVLKFVPHNIEHYDETRKMFFESFEKVHNLHHQNICPLYAVSIDPKYGPFLVMQYIDGISLSQYYKNKAGKGGLSFSTTLSILREIAVALDFAHSRKIIHRDIKPQNIMISRTEGVQIIDFGIADYIRTDIRTTDFDLTNQRSGTRLYMAPEQWEGKKQDARTDQYSLAVLAYELLSGKVPFNIQDIEILRRCVLNDHPEILKSQSAAVNAALQKALAKNRKDRFDTCLAFVDAL